MEGLEGIGDHSITLRIEHEMGSRRHRHESNEPDQWTIYVMSGLRPRGKYRERRRAEV